MASFDIRSYREWFLDADYTPAYEAHRRTLQHLQWHNPGRWVLKYPKHLLSLDALLAAYPDAVLIWTHRDPAAVLPSAVSLTGFMRQSEHARLRPGALRARVGGHRGAGAAPRASRRVTATANESAPSSTSTTGSLMRDPVGTVGHAVRAARRRLRRRVAAGRAAVARRQPAGQARRAPLHAPPTSVSTPTACAPASTSTRGGSCDLRRDASSSPA